mgnify:CR=1 FL=1
MRTRLHDAAEYVRASFWFLPTLMTLFAAGCRRGRAPDVVGVPGARAQIGRARRRRPHPFLKRLDAEPVNGTRDRHWGAPLPGGRHGVLANEDRVAPGLRPDPEPGRADADRA